MKNKYPRLLTALCALILSVGSLWADRVTQEDAALVAANFFNAPDTTQTDTTQSGKTPRRSRTMRRVALADEAQYYVYENANGEGWVMVAANDVAHPILAYSDEGYFRTDQQPANLKSWLGGYNKQIKYAEENNIEATEEVKSEWQALRKGVRKAKQAVVVGPLLTTLWDQDTPYWNLCPKKSGVNTYTGCVATAMAQVMNYWEWPEKGTSSASVTCSGTTYTVNFANTTYDWSNMNDRYTQYYNEGDKGYTEYSVGTTAQQNAVATLMYHCGVAVNMSYGTPDEGGSGAQTISTSESTRCAQNALWKNFGYKKSEIKGYYRDGGYGYDSWTRAEWIAMLKEELDASRPIMYAGGDAQGEGGHSFVCDGYNSSSMFHFNWGWSGYCNGYYDVDALDPGPGGSGSGNSGDYSYMQDVIVGIIPDKPSVTVTWMANGSTFTTTTQSTGKLELPASSPSACSSGKVFVGWTASSSVSGSAPADLFSTVTTQVIADATTYYAVYATATAGGSITPTIASSIAEGDEVVLVYETSSVKKELSGFTTSGTIYGQVADYTSSPAGTYALSVVAGNSTGTLALKNGNNYLCWSSGNSLSTTTTLDASSSWKISFSDGNAVIVHSNDNTRSIRYNTSSPRFACYANSGQSAVKLYKMGVGTSYSDYSLTCGAACSNTPSMSFSAPTTVSKTTADGSFTKAVTISGKGSGQTVAYSSSDETIATVTNAGVVTLKGKGGSATITASVEANGTYCAASASYTINVTAAPINVTLYYNNTSATLNNQTPPYTLPTTGTYVAAMCDGDWTFDGWLGSTYTKSETKPTYITQLDATGSAYAVYKTTETTSGAPVRKAKMGTTDDVLDLSFTGVSGTSYSAWSGKTGTSGAVYAGNSAGGNDAIQLRSNNSNSGIVTTTTGGTATKVVVTWNSSTDNARSITIYGKNTAYSSAADLYSSSSTTQGTSLGTISKGSTTLNITGSYAYIGIRSTSGALYLDDVTITWSSSGGTTTKTYYATSPDCAVACALTGITLNTSSVTKTFTQDGEFNSTGLVVTASYSNCADKTVSANVTAPSLATTGEKTVTVSYTEGGVTKEATYKINVVAPYTVTYKVCGDVYTTQTYAPNAALVLPEEPGGFDGLTFQGWTTTEHYTGNSAPAYISAGGAVNANVTYYAVFH